GDDDRSGHFIASSILFNNLLQFLRHFRDGIESHFHLAIVAAPNDRVHVSELWIFVWKIFAELRSPALFSLNRGTRYRFGNSSQVLQLKRGMPAGIELAV